jgi:hypothetical protein
MAQRKPPVTSSRRRADRQAGKGAASKPSPRQTSAGNRGAQQGPLRPTASLIRNGAAVTRGGKPRGARSYSTQMRAPVTSDANRPAASSSSNRVTTGRGAAASTNKTAANILKTASALMSVSKGGVKAAAVKEGLTARNTADGTLKGKSPANVKGPAVPARLTQGGLDKGSFDNAFRMSRKAGKSTFTWRGKKYNTKQKGE